MLTVQAFDFMFENVHGKIWGRNLTIYSMPFLKYLLCVKYAR